MKAAGEEPPRGIVVVGGEWHVPVLFGVDAETVEAAEAYGVDHNTAGLRPAGLTPKAIARLFDVDRLRPILGRREAERPVSLSASLVEGLTADAGKRQGKAGGNEAALEAAEEAQAHWKVAPGDIWRVGGHFLWCGDCQNEVAVANLLDLASVDRSRLVVLTDPPYSSGAFQEAGKAAGTWGQIASDSLSTRGFISLLRGALVAARPTVAYLFIDWRMWATLYDITESAGLPVRSMIVWDKGTPGLGGLWRPQHELILFASRKGSKRQKYQAAIGNVLRYPRTGNKHHYTEKPVELVEDLLRNDARGGRSGWAVLDPFVGSGTSLLACRELGRPGVGIDVEPLCVAMALSRLAAVSELQPVKVEG